MAAGNEGSGSIYNYREARKKRARQEKRARSLLAVLLAVVMFGAGTGTGWFLWGREKSSGEIDLKAIETPVWIEKQFLTPNIYSRPGASRNEINGIVVHYIANPGTTAEQNRNYFENLSKQSGDNAVSSSAHFIIGLEGEIIQCMPIREIAYASNNRNVDTVSIECCHPDETGEFTEETYESLVRLTSWLMGELDLKETDIIRHYDITGKNCPKYFVEHESAWKQFKKDAGSYEN